MDNDPDKVICRFRYTSREYRKAIGLRTRATSAKSYFYMALPLLVLGLVFCPQAVADYHAAQFSKTASQNWQAAFSDITPLLFLIGIIGLLFSPLGGFFYAFFFRGQLNHNRDVEWTLAPPGLHYSSEVAQSDLAWAVVKRAREDKNGFLFEVGRRQFLWMSHYGFESGAELTRARQMIRTAVRDFKSYCA